MDDYKLESGMDDTNLDELLEIIQQEDYENSTELIETQQNPTITPIKGFTNARKPKTSDIEAFNYWTPEQKEIMFALGNTKTHKDLVEPKIKPPKVKEKGAPAKKWYEILEAVKKEAIPVKAEYESRLKAKRLQFPDEEFLDYEPEWKIVYSSDGETSSASMRVALLNRANSTSGYWPPGLWKIRSRKEFDKKKNYFIRSVVEVQFINTVEIDETGVFVMREKVGKRSRMASETE